MKGLETIRFISLLLLIALVPGCKCTCDDPTDPDCKNYDPCYGVEETSADFDAYATVFPTFDEENFWRTLILTDTIQTYRALFEVKQDGSDSVKWKIGQEPDYRTGESCYVDFYPTAVGEIDVTCIIYRQPSTSCFPTDDGIDTMTRSILIAHPDSFAWFKGKYRCVVVGESDSFTATIRLGHWGNRIEVDSINFPCFDTARVLRWSATTFYMVASCGIKDYDPYPPLQFHINRDGTLWSEYYQYGYVGYPNGIKKLRLEGYKL